MTNEQQKAQIKALLRERAGYQQKGLSDRVKAVDEQLSRLGHKGTPPAGRAAKRGK